MHGLAITSAELTKRAQKVYFLTPLNSEASDSIDDDADAEDDDDDDTVLRPPAVRRRLTAVQLRRQQNDPDQTPARGRPPVVTVPPGAVRQANKGQDLIAFSNRIESAAASISNPRPQP